MKGSHETTVRHTLELTPINSFDTPTFNCASGIDEITSGTICSLVKLSITPFQTSRIILQRSVNQMESCAFSEVTFHW